MGAIGMIIPGDIVAENFLSHRSLSWYAEGRMLLLGALHQDIRTFTP
jgi:hypothetical protein